MPNFALKKDSGSNVFKFNKNLFPACVIREKFVFSGLFAQY